MDLRTQQPTRLSLDLLPAWLEDDRFVVEEKFDGHRVSVLAQEGRIDTRNRHGDRYRARPLPGPVEAALGPISGLSWLDGELCDDRYMVFDLRVHEGHNLHPAPFTQRRSLLETLAAANGWDRGPVLLSRAAFDHHARTELCMQVLEAGGEGVVLKRADSPYTPGRTTTWRKAKYVQLLHAVAGMTSNRGRTELFLYDDAGVLTKVGTAACYDRAPLPGTTIVVRYRSTRSGGLQEQVVVNTASDADPSSCRLSQLQASWAPAKSSGT